jgi:hypothetical protein
MKIKLSLLASLLAMTGLYAAGARADVITSNSGLLVIEDFESFDGVVTRGPLLLSGGVVVTSNVYSTVGADVVDLLDNGAWGAGNRFAGIGDLSIVPSTFEGYVGSMTFDLGGAYRGVGALFSIYNDGLVSGEVTIEALGAGNSVLESTTFVVDLNDPLSYNAGLFYGFSRASADIVGLRISGDGFVVDNLSVAPVPLPAAAWLLISGLLGLGVFRRRRA